MEYISDKFQTIGLVPKGSDGFYQPFEIYEGKQINEGTYFIINDAALDSWKRFFPISILRQKND